MARSQSTNKALLNTLEKMNRKVRQGFYSLETGGKNLTEAGANELKSKIETKYNAFISELASEGDAQNHTHHIDITPRGDGGYDVDVIGLEVLYDEFGTGIVGAVNPHPQKGKYALQPYNSGETIRHFPDNPGRDYWIYNTNGKYHVSHGVRAGMFMHDSITDMMSAVWVKNYYKEAYKDFFNIMKGK